MHYESFEAKLHTSPNYKEKVGFLSLAKSGLIAGYALNVLILAARKWDLKTILLSSIKEELLYVVLLTIFYIAFFGVISYNILYFILELLEYTEVLDRKKNLVNSANSNTKNQIHNAYELKNVENENITNENITNENITNKINTDYGTSTSINNIIDISTENSEFNYEQENTITTIKRNLVSLRVKTIDIMRLMVASAYMIPLAAFGLFFIVSGFVIMTSPSQKNGVLGGVIFIILGLIPVFAGIRPFRENLQVFQAQYFGVEIDQSDKEKRKAELIKKLPLIIFSSVLILLSIATAFAPNPLDSSITGTIIQLILALIVMTIGLFLFVHVAKK